MAFITAATRSDIVELAMGMLNQAPSTAMLNTLIEKSTAGSTIQELADYIATTDAFTSEYPSTQTAKEFATEMFAKLTTGGTLSAAINTAVIDLLEGMLTAGTTKAEGFVAVIDYLSNTANNTNADLGDISKSFQNRADAAEYFSITKELGGSTDAELAAAIATVTSDAATLTAANTAADGTAAVVVVTPGSTFTLTTGTDFVAGTVNNDLINAVRAGSAGLTETYSPVDQVAGGAGIDTLYVESDATSVALATVTGVEKIQVNAADAAVTTAVTLPNDKAYTTLESLNSLGNLTFSSIKVGSIDASLIASPNGKTTTLNYGTTALLGATDNLDVLLSSADGDLDITGGSALNALETITLNAVSDGEIDDLNLTNANTTKLVITGSGATTITGITGAAATLNSINASAATGAVSVTGVNATGNTITGGAGNDSLSGAAGNDVITGGEGADQLTGGAGNDHLDGGAGNDTFVVSSVTKDDTVAGGEGTDTLTLAAAVTYSATVNSGTNITGIEAIKTAGSFTQNMLGLAGNTIDTVSVAAANTVVIQGSAVTTVNSTVNGSGTLSIGLATDGTTDATAVNLGSVIGGTASTLTLNAVDTETLNVMSQGADGNSLTMGNTTAGTLTVAAATATATDLTTINVMGSKNVTVTAGTKSTAVSKIDASTFTGNTVSVSATSSTAAMTVTASGAYSATVNSGKGADTITVGDGGTANANTVNGGDGADTIVAGAGNDTLNGGDDGGSITAGAGNDTVSSGDGADTIVLGDGDDTVSDSGAANDVITGGAGNDTVTTAGAGNDSIDGGTGNDNLTGGAGADTIIGGEGNDVLAGGTGNDSITGGDGNDSITDGTGDDVIDAGAGNDTITISSGSDNVDAGAGNDTISITGLTSADTIDGGTGTDTLTVTNSSASTTTPSFIGIESLVVNTSTGFALDFTSATDKTTTKTYNISGTDSGGTDDVVITNAPSGSTFTISDDKSWDGASATDTNDTGDLDEITIDTVAGATVSITIDANRDAATPTDTNFTTALNVGDAAVVTLTGTGGTASNPLDHDTVALKLDDTETRTLTVTAPANTGLDIGDITQAAAMQEMTFTSAAGADSDMGTLSAATALNSLTLSTTGASSTLNTGAIGGGTTAVLTSLSVSAADAAVATIGAITSTGADAITSVAITTTGANSKISHDDFNLGASAVASFNLNVAANSHFFPPSAKAITMGTVTAGAITIGDYATIGTNASSTIDGEFTKLTLTVGTGVTWTNDIILATVDTGNTELVVNLNTGAEAIDFNTGGGDELRIVGTTNAFTIDESDFEKMTVNFNGTGAIKWTASNASTSLSVSGAGGVDSLTGGAGNDTLRGNAGNDVIASTGGNNTLDGGDGNDSVTGGTGADNITAGNGQDTITAGAGNDTITLTEDTQSVDTVAISNGGSSDASTQATTAGGDDTGADTITGFDAGATADQLNIVTATGVTNFNHVDDVVFGTGTTAGTSTGIIADFATSALIFDFNGDGDAKDDNIDLVINMNSLKIDGVAVATSTRATALTNIKADIAYNITGSTGGDTIVAGDLADTIATNGGATSVTGGAAADSITGGGGIDTIVFTATTAAALATEVGSTAATDVDVATGVGEAISTFTSGTDKLKFPAALLTNVIGTEVDTLKTIVKGGTVANTDRYVFISNGASSDNTDQTGAVIALLNSLTTSAVAIGDSFLVGIDNDTNVYLYLVEQVSTADTIAAQDVTAVGVLNGIVAVGNGDFVST